jgi:hypothetical protein
LEDLKTWTTIGTLTNELGITDLIDPMNGRDRRFYRLRQGSAGASPRR